MWYLMISIPVVCTLTYFIPQITYFDVSDVIHIHDIWHNDCLKSADVNNGLDC